MLFSVLLRRCDLISLNQGIVLHILFSLVQETYNIGQRSLFLSAEEVMWHN